MKASDMMARLQSPSLSTRIEATYQLEREDFDDSEVLAAVRENLSLDDPDLLDITIMRLLLRGRDKCSVERVLSLIESTRDNLVFSSGVLSLSGLAGHSADIREEVLRRFELFSRDWLEPKNITLLEREITKLHKMTA